MMHQVHHHHDNEEKIFFPMLAYRIQLPPKMTADHKTLLEMLERTATNVKALVVGDAATNAAALATLTASFNDMSMHMREHLLEEEHVGLPMMRHNFVQVRSSSQ